MLNRKSKALKYTWACSGGTMQISHSLVDILTPKYNAFTCCLPCASSVDDCHWLFSPPKPPPCLNEGLDLAPPGLAEELHGLWFAHLCIQTAGGRASAIYSALENGWDKENPIMWRKVPRALDVLEMAGSVGRRPAVNQIHLQWWAITLGTAAMLFALPHWCTE